MDGRSHSPPPLLFLDMQVTFDPRKPRADEGQDVKVDSFRKSLWELL